MNFFSNLFKRKVPVQTLEVVTTQVIAPEVKEGDFRSGVWVKCPDGRMGITIRPQDHETLVGMTDARGWNVEDVDEFGNTYNLTHLYKTSEIRRAKISELPSERMERSGMDATSLRNLGYGD